MREFRFKFWNKRNNRWEKDPLETSPYYQNPFSNEDLIPCQFTGLKDKEGTEVYDGDIVRCWKEHCHCGEDGKMKSGFATAEICNSGWSFYYRQITSDDKRGWFFYGPDGDEFSPHDPDYEWMEVIGNIYENPDLMRQSNKSEV